mmetsp:Transcript_10227/g.33845  ORF Transcript_10227/g.33845 Transcript_10227/m.33845 type:complete len:229 (-) Transcript_10227:110-796(-)
MVLVAPLAARPRVLPRCTMRRIPLRPGRPRAGAARRVPDAGRGFGFVVCSSAEWELPVGRAAVRFSRIVHVQRRATPLLRNAAARRGLYVERQGLHEGRLQGGRRLAAVGRARAPRPACQVRRGPPGCPPRHLAFHPVGSKGGHRRPQRLWQVVARLGVFAPQLDLRRRHHLRRPRHAHRASRAAAESSGRHPAGAALVQRHAALQPRPLWRARRPAHPHNARRAPRL